MRAHLNDTHNQVNKMCTLKSVFFISIQSFGYPNGKADCLNIINECFIKAAYVEMNKL